MGDGFDLRGHVAVVTGGNSGIGRGIADGLARAGADVAIWGRTAERNAQAREELAAHGTRVADVVCDVSDPGSVDEAFSRTLQALGRIDSCFANAGGGELHAAFVDMALDDFRRIVAVNLDGAFLTFQGAARHMIERGGGGSLVGISSLAAVEGMARGQHYAAAKAGLVAMTRSIAVELARHGIRANAILPGWIETPATERQFASLGDRILKRIPQRRWGQPEDFVGAAVYLASPASAYHTGDELVIDGGYRVF
jgi:NAD(P)-dependent dehydrogenase (short-subunit alcohol dehydrogenase family)